jgi:hypothetical protein
MIHIETVDLSSRGVTLPSDRVGMVIAQPYLSLTASEPYRCTPQTKPQQMQMLTDTLRVALAAVHGAPKTHFTIFPEYGIPGLDGIALLDTALRATNWPTGSIVIGGIDALSKPDLVTLVGEPGTHMDTVYNSLDRVAQDEWINCAITWVKAENGAVERWLQPKLFPAWPEQDVTCQGMFRGASVFTFNGPFDNGDTRYRFCSLICFDWVATMNNQKAWRSVMVDLGRQAASANAELSLSWLFVIQRNPKPSHDSFLAEVGGFFDQTAYPNVRRERACLVFANSAGKPSPGRAELYGSTSLVFSGQTLFAKHTCSATFSNGGQRFRSSTLLSPYYDVFFRERGACIHSFSQINPNSLVAGAAGRTIALYRAFIFPLDGVTDPRAPGAEVPACTKWLNDELDQLPSLSASYQTAPLANQVDKAHQLTTAALRALPPPSAKNAVKLAAQESEAEHEDEWGDRESEAVRHLVHTLDIVGVGFPPPTVGAVPPHATVLIGNKTVDIVVIRGSSHESCIKHSKGFLPNPQRQVLLVSRDDDNTPWPQRFGSFLEPNTSALGQEPKITDPSSGSLHLGYQNLLDIFRHSTTAGEIEGGIRAALAA